MFCADCGAKMYNHRGKAGKARDWAGRPNGKRRPDRDEYNCSRYDLGNQRYDTYCTTHLIRTAVVNELLLEAIKEVCNYAQNNEAAFIEQVCSASGERQKKAIKTIRQRKQRSEKRADELSRLIRIRMQAMAYVQEPEVLRVVPVGKFERYIKPGEVTQDQYIVKGGILLSPCASNPDFYESTNRALNGTYIGAQIYEVAERSKKGKPTAFRKAEDAPVENPLEPVGKEIGIIKAGGIPCGLVFQHEMEGFELQDHTILLQKERDAHGNYYSGLSFDGMMVKTPQMYAAVTDEHGKVTASAEREKDFSRQKPKEAEKKLSIREQLAKKQPVKSPVKPSAKHKETER